MFKLLGSLFGLFFRLLFGIFSFIIAGAVAVVAGIASALVKPGEARDNYYYRRELENDSARSRIGR